MSPKATTKSPQQIAHVREAGKYWLELMTQLRDRAKAGVALLELEDHAESYMRKHDIRGSFKGYG